MNRRTLLLTALFVLSAPPALAKTKAKPVSKAHVQALLEISGVKSQLVSMAKGLRAQVASHPALDDTMRATLMKNVDRILNEKTMFASVVKKVSAKPGQAQLDAARAFFGKEPGKTLAKWTGRMSDPSTRQGLMTYMVAASQMSPERRKLLDELVKVSEAETYVAKATTNAMVAMMTGMKESIPPDAAEDLAAMDGMLGQLAAGVDAQAAQMAQLITGFKLRELEDAKIREVTAFYGSKGGRWYNSVVQAAVIETTRESAYELGRALGKAGAAIGPEGGLRKAAPK